MAWKGLPWNALACGFAAAAVIASAACSDDTAPPQTSPSAGQLTPDEMRNPQVCAACHPDHVREWSGSMHAYAGIDPVFLALNRRMQRETNGALGNFCVQCHAPLAVRAGLTKDGLNLAELDPKMLGVNCFFCHAAEFTNGNLHNNPLDLVDDGVMRGGIQNPLPAPHGVQFSTSHAGAFDRSALFCGTCHDIVNTHGAHIERTFFEWRRTSVAIEDRTNCSGCHMPARTGPAAIGKHSEPRTVHDHSMPGVDLALTPFPEMQAQRAGVEKSLGEAIATRMCVTADPTTAGVRIEVTIRNDGVGHSWPSGSAQDRRAWVELEGRRGQVVVLESGRVGERQSVAEAADPRLFLLRDHHFDEHDAETHLFWQTVRVESHLVPARRSSQDPDSTRSRTHVYSFPNTALPEEVTMRVKLRPLDFDLIDELVRSGDLDATIAEQIPTFDIASAMQTWRPGPDCVGYEVR